MNNTNWTDDMADTNNTDDTSTETVHVWLGFWASVWAHRGYAVHSETVECESVEDAQRVGEETLGVNLTRVCVGATTYVYTTSEAAVLDTDGSGADAVITISRA